jgi:predicted N-acetyltransferase YhbS
MTKPSLRVISPVQSEHTEQVIELCAKTFGGYFNFRNDLRKWYLLNSPYDWEASAIGLANGQIATHYGVWDYQMRIGKGVVRCGGIGCVATHGDYRKQGLMAQTVPHSLARMKDRGYDLTILFGIWDFYHRFGYVQAWQETTWIIQRDRLPKDLPKVKYQSFTAEPRENIATLHNRHNAQFTGAAVRPMFTAKYSLFRGGLEGYSWNDAKGKLTGHVLLYQDGTRLVCIEATGEPDAALAVLGSLCKKKAANEIRFETLPYLSPLAKRLRQLTCRVERQYIKSGGAMVRVVNLKSCLQRMEQELSDRLQQSDLDGYRGELLVRGPEAGVGLKIAKGKVTVADRVSSKSALRGGFEIAQLLMGTGDPMETCESGQMRLSGEAARLVKVLFPNEYPQLHQADRY